jgi:hypothetical protein
MNDQTSQTPMQTPMQTPAQNQDQTQVQNCANCGMPKDEWRGNNGQGFQMAGKTYCCQGCAAGTGCTCG